MSKISSIIQKEFRIFFNSAIGYVFLAVFLGFSGWLFFRTFFLFGQADLRAFFLFLPWTFLFLIPAFTMRAWAEETRAGTIETLFTSGLASIKIILAKGLSMLLFLALALFLTLPFAISVSFLGNLDWGVVLISYLGALLLGLSYITLGLLISALTRNQIVAFLISVLLCFAFYIIGENFITVFFPAPMAEILTNLGLGAHYKSMIRGVIDTRDLLFYLGFISIFFTANIATLSAQFWPHKYFWRTVTSATLVIASLINIVGQFAFARFDGTEDQNYTLSAASKNIIQNLEKPVTLKVFISDNVPAQMQSLTRDVRDLLAEYQLRGARKLTIETLDPLQDDTAQEWAQSFQIPPLQLQVIEQDQQQVVKVFLGIAITLENPDEESFSQRFPQYEVLPAVTQLEDFEYQLTTAIKKISTEQLPVIGFLTDHGTKKLSNLNSRKREEAEDTIPIRDLKNYEIREITLPELKNQTPPAEITENPPTEKEGETEKPETEGIATLLILGPTENFTEPEAQQIKDFLANGGNLIFAADPIQIMGSFTQNSATDFRNLLADFGLSLKTALVADAVNAQAFFQSGIFSISRPYPLWVKSTNLAQNNSITKDLPALLLPWPSPLNITEIEGVTNEILAQTSPYFVELPGQKLVEIPAPETNAETEQTDENKNPTPEPPVAPEKIWQDTAISLDPEQDFGLSRQKKKPLPLIVLSQKETGGKLLVAANTHFLTHQFIGNSPANLIFLNNAIDALTIGDELISIRSKQIKERPLKLISNETKATIRWTNILLMPLLIVAFGLIRHFLRKQRKLKLG